MTFPGSQWYYGWNSTWPLACLPDPKKELDTKVWRTAGADPSLSGPAVAVYGAAAHQEKKREERLGDSPVLGSAYRASPWNPYLHTVPGSLCFAESQVMFGFQLHPLSFTNILGARTLLKTQLFKFESQTLYERPISVSIGKKKWNWGMGWPDVITSEVGEVLCEVRVFPFILRWVYTGSRVHHGR